MRIFYIIYSTSLWEVVFWGRSYHHLPINCHQRATVQNIPKDLVIWNCSLGTLLGHPGCEWALPSTLLALRMVPQTLSYKAYNQHQVTTLDNFYQWQGTWSWIKSLLNLMHVIPCMLGEMWFFSLALHSASAVRHLWEDKEGIRVIALRFFC